MQNITAQAPDWLIKWAKEREQKRWPTFMRCKACGEARPIARGPLNDNDKEFVRKHVARCFSFEFLDEEGLLIVD